MKIYPRVNVKSLVCSYYLNKMVMLCTGSHYITCGIYLYIFEDF